MQELGQQENILTLKEANKVGLKRITGWLQKSVAFDSQYGEQTNFDWLKNEKERVKKSGIRAEIVKKIVKKNLRFALFVDSHPPKGAV